MKKVYTKRNSNDQTQEITLKLIHKKKKNYNYNYTEIRFLIYKIGRSQQV